MGKKKHIRGTAIRLEFPKSVIEQAKSTNQIYQQGRFFPNRPNINGGNQQLLQQAAAAHGGSRPDSLNTEPETELTLDKLLGRANDENSLRAALADWEVVVQNRLELRRLNVKPDYDAFEELIEEKKLDSTLKKCSGFVKRLRSYTSSQRSTVEKEFQSLNLTKFLSEICRAVTSEARLKVSDVNDVVFICSNLHQRYREFSGLVLEAYKKVLFRKADITAAFLSKLCVDLRIIGEFVINGFFEASEGYALISSCIRNLLVIDKDGQQCVVPVLSFIRTTAAELAGIIPRNIRELCAEFNVVWPTVNDLPRERTIQMTSLLKEYFSVIVKTLLKLNDDVLESETHNRKFLRSRGEVPKDREEAHMEIVTKFEKFRSSTRKLSKFLDFPFPNLKALPPEPEPEQCKIVMAAGKGEGREGLTPGLILFDCEETRSFYQDLPDMKVYLPQVVYRDNLIQAALETEAIAEREKQAANLDVDTEVAELVEEISPLELDDPVNDTEELPLCLQPEDEKSEEKVRPSFQAYIVHLTNCVNQKMIDQAAIDFVDKFNNKPNRKKLIRVLFHIPRQRVDLLPLWSRFVAILAPVMPAIYLELCQMLYKDFRHLLKKKDQIFIETKVKITRFIGELVNFGLFPKADAFQCFKMLLMDFVHHQVEMACAFVETCGRLLHRSPDTHRRMHIYLEEMMRKRTVKNLEPRYISMVDHAYYFVCPPESTRVKAKLPVMCAYVKYLISSLTKANLEDTVHKMRSLKWSDPETSNYAMSLFSQPAHLTFPQLRLCASLLSALVPYQSVFTTRVVDNILEDIQHTLETNDVRMNQHRISTVVYLGELYSYRIFGSSIIFTVLYAFITYGVSLDYSVKSPLDPPDNLFRVRLACTLLKTCGEFFCAGMPKKKLVYYMKYLQRYYWFKKNHRLFEKRPFPYAISEILQETFRLLRPRYKMAETFEEARQEVTKLEDQLKVKFRAEIDFAQKDYKVKMERFVQVSEFRGEASPAVTTPSPSLDPFAQPEDPVAQEQETDNLTPEEEAEFTRMYEQMCMVSNVSRPLQPDIPVPLNVRTSKPVTPEDPVYSENGEKLVNFTLLTKSKGKKNAKSLLIPESSDYVKKIRSREKAEMEERAQMKVLTLGMSKMQEAEEREAELKELLRIDQTQRELTRGIPMRKLTASTHQYQFR